MVDPVTHEVAAPMEVTAGPKSILSPPKLKKHGVTVVLAAEEVKTSFTVDFTFSTTQSSSSKLNLGNLHRLLFQHMLEAAEDQTIRLLPTQEKSTAQTVGDLTDFPRIEKEHRAFFHRSTFHHHDRNQVKIRVKHTAISKTPLAKIRNKIMPFLRANDIYLRSSAFDREDTVCIAWILGAHPKLSFRPTFDNLINDGISALQLNDEQNQELARICDDGQEAIVPKIFVAPRTQHYGNGEMRVSSHTLGICCLKRHAKLLKELTAQIDLDQYRIIPQGIRQMTNETIYRKFLLANNDLQNNLRSIAVVGLIPQALEWEFHVDYKDAYFKMKDYCTKELMFYSIEKTHNSDITGRFLFVVQNQNYEASRAALIDFLADIFPFHENATTYEAYFNTPGPKLASAPPPGGVIQSCVDKLVAELNEVESKDGSLRDKPKPQAWKTANTHIHFDLDDDEEFPAMKTKPEHQQLMNDNQSVAPTRISAKSGVSTDMSTIVSDMQSMVSAQSKMMDGFMKQQAEQFKQQQEITTQQISSLITLVTQLIPSGNNFPVPPPMMYYPPQQPQYMGTPLSPPQHFDRTYESTLSQLRPSGKVMDVDTPTHPAHTKVNTVTPRATKRNEHPEDTPPRPNPARTDFSTPDRNAHQTKLDVTMAPPGPYTNFTPPDRIQRQTQNVVAQPPPAPDPGEAKKHE